MSRRVAVSNLNASTIKILNTIRANASYEYQQAVPKVTKKTDIPKVGEVIYGTPAFANQFINALINRIALVRVRSTIFNNPYARLKSGRLEYGETIEDVFVEIAKVVDYDVEDAPAREFQRTLPGVKSQFAVINWRVMYPVTIEDEQLRAAFLSIDGVQDMIARIVDSIYQAAQVDEFLLFKYLLMKAITEGEMYPVSIGDGTNMSEAAVQFRGISNLLTFPSSGKYNVANVINPTPRERQVIFMDSMYNASFDVNVLASAFNMDKATFMGSLFLIDDWTSFDEGRWDVIRANSDGLEPVTPEMLAVLANVKAVVVDEDWFLFYDYTDKFTEKYVASGLYWNYFYHVWKIVSHSNFHNAIVYVTGGNVPAVPETITYEIMSKDVSEEAVTMAIIPQFDGAVLNGASVKLVQTQALVEAGIAVNPYGAITIPQSAVASEIILVAELNGTTYTAGTAITSASNVGDKIALTKS